MATFSQQFLANLGRPQMTQGMMQLGTALGGLPQQAQAQQKRQELAEIMKLGNAALATGDAVNIGRVRRQLEAAGFAKEAAAMAQAEAQARKTQAASGMLMSAVSGEKLDPEVIRERVGEGLTAQDLTSSMAIQKALFPPYLTRAEQIELLDTFTPASVQAAVEAKSLAGLQTKPDADFDYSETIREWVDPAAPDTVILKTIQGDDGNAYELGTKSVQNPRGRRVPEAEIKPLQLRKSAGVQVSTGVKDPYLKRGLEQAAELDIQAIEAGNSSLATMSVIADAKRVLQETPGIFGAGASEFQAFRKGALTFLRSVGVGEGDAFFDKVSKASTNGEVALALTQDFVVERLQGTKGAISDAEFKTFQASVPNLMQTPGGYAKLLNRMEAMAQRRIMYGNLIEENMPKGKEAVTKATKVWKKFIADFPSLTYMPADQQAVLWNEYQRTNGKINKNDVQFTMNTPDGLAGVTYGDMVSLATKHNKTIYELIEDRYADPALDFQISPSIVIK